MAVRDDRSDVKQTTTGFRGPLMVQSLTSAKSKFLSLIKEKIPHDVDPASVGNELIAKAAEDAAKAVYQKLLRTNKSRTSNKKIGAKKKNSKITGRDQ